MQHKECHMQDNCAKYSICPMVLVQEMMSGKWKILILWYLSYRVLRFSDIKKRMPQITQKMLTLQLRSLEEDKLIYRTIFPVIPPKVEYGLTDLGKKLIPLLDSMHSFGIEFLEAKANNQAAEN